MLCTKEEHGDENRANFSRIVIDLLVNFTHNQSSELIKRKESRKSSIRFLLLWIKYKRAEKIEKNITKTYIQSTKRREICVATFKMFTSVCVNMNFHKYPTSINIYFSFV